MSAEAKATKKPAKIEEPVKKEEVKAESPIVAIVKEKKDFHKELDKAIESSKLKYSENHDLNCLRTLETQLRVKSLMKEVK